MRAFWPIGYFEFNLVTFLQALVSFRCNCAVVDKYVRPIFAANETVAFGIVKPLHRTLQTFHLRPLGHEPLLIPGRAFRFAAIFQLPGLAVKGTDHGKRGDLCFFFWPRS